MTAAKKVEDKRQAILDAALSLFAEQGFHGTKVPEIARKAGVAAGTIYQYFEGKEALVNTLYRDCRGLAQTQLLDDFPLEAGPRELFAAYWKRLLEFAIRYPKVIAFLDFHHHGPYLDAQSTRVEKQNRETLKPIVEGAQRQGHLKKIQPEVIMAIIVGAMIGLVKAAREGNVKLTAQTIAQAEEVCWSGISTPAARGKG